MAAKVDVTFLNGQSLVGILKGHPLTWPPARSPSVPGRTRRWFGKTWHAT